jgi:hypothetical protein
MIQMLFKAFSAETFREAGRELEAASAAAEALRDSHSPT